jgi:hypothetical protein
MLELLSAGSPLYRTSSKLLEALSPSFPFPSSRLSPLIGCVTGERPGATPRARFPVTCCIGVALLVCLWSLRIHRLWKWPASREKPRGVLPPAAAQGESGMDGVQIQVSFGILNYVSIILMFIPGIRPAGTSYCASFSGSGLDSLVARTGASVIVNDCNLCYRG